MTAYFWMIAFGLSFLLAYFSPLGLPLAIVLGGIINLWALRRVTALHGAQKLFVLTLFIYLLWLFVRSDFVIALTMGQDILSALKSAKWPFTHTVIISISALAWLLAIPSLSPDLGQKITKMMAIGLTFLVGIMLIEAITQGALSQFWRTNLVGTNRPDRILVWLSDANSVLLFLFWPLAYGLARLGRGWLAYLIGLAIIMIAIKADTDAQILALILSSLVFFLITSLIRQPKVSESLIGHGIGLGMAACVLIFPLILTVIFQNPASDSLIQSLPQSWEERMKIWEFTIEMAERKWLLGWGVESARHFDPFIPTHPHSMALQAWLELGLIGLVILSLLWYLAALSLARLKTPNWDQIPPLAYGLAGLSAFYTINFLSYGLWRSWLYSAALLMVIILVMLVRHGPDQPTQLENEES